MQPMAAVSGSWSCACACPLSLQHPAIYCVVAICPCFKAYTHPEQGPSPQTPPLKHSACDHSQRSLLITVVAHSCMRACTVMHPAGTAGLDCIAWRASSCFVLSCLYTFHPCCLPLSYWPWMWWGSIFICIVPSRLEHMQRSST